MAGFQTLMGTGVLICEDHDITTRYVLHLDVGGQAMLIELLDRPHGLACGGQVHVIIDDGRALECQVLDDTSMCAVIGDGFLRRR